MLGELVLLTYFVDFTPDTISVRFPADDSSPFEWNNVAALSQEKRGRRAIVAFGKTRDLLLRDVKPEAMTAWHEIDARTVYHPIFDAAAPDGEVFGAFLLYVGFDFEGVFSRDRDRPVRLWRDRCQLHVTVPALDGLSTDQQAVFRRRVAATCFGKRMALTLNGQAITPRRAGDITLFTLQKWFARWAATLLATTVLIGPPIAIEALYRVQLGHIKGRPGAEHDLPPAAETEIADGVHLDDPKPLWPWTREGEILSVLLGGRPHQVGGAG